jgi:hypothetical protein
MPRHFWCARLFGTNVADIRMAPNAHAGNHRRLDLQTREHGPLGGLRNWIGRRAWKGDNIGKYNMFSNGTGKAWAHARARNPQERMSAGSDCDEASPRAYLWDTARSSRFQYVMEFPSSAMLLQRAASLRFRFIEGRGRVPRCPVTKCAGNLPWARREKSLRIDLFTMPTRHHTTSHMHSTRGAAGRRTAEGIYGGAEK